MSILPDGNLWSIEQGDCRDWLARLPDDCVDLAITSPPYVDARTYGIGFALKGEDWVAWMRGIALELVRVCRGLVAIVVEGKTENYRYDCTPLLLAADLHRAGCHLRKPAVYFRYGIPGSGGPDWWRNDWEPILCLSKGGKLPWSDNTACGHPPKYAPGGEMSHRSQSGKRVNQWGGGEKSGATRRKKGERQAAGRPSHKVITRPREGQSSQESTEYTPPTLANPGNVVKETYDAEQVRQLLEAFATRQIDQGDVLRCLVGSGQMGPALCHENEAPYPEALVEPFIKSFCPPGGIVLDPFAGSGTTLAVAVRLGRRAIGCDVRQSQVELTRKRLSLETPGLFGGCDHGRQSDTSGAGSAGDRQSPAGGLDDQAHGARQGHAVPPLGRSGVSGPARPGEGQQALQP